MEKRAVNLPFKTEDELEDLGYASWCAEVVKMNNAPLTKTQLDNGWAMSIVRSLADENGASFDDAISNINRILHMKDVPVASAADGTQQEPAIFSEFTFFQPRTVDSSGSTAVATTTAAAAPAQATTTARPTRDTKKLMQVAIAREATKDFRGRLKMGHDRFGRMLVEKYGAMMTAELIETVWKVEKQKRKSFFRAGRMRETSGTVVRAAATGAAVAGAQGAQNVAQDDAEVDSGDDDSSDYDMED